MQRHTRWIAYAGALFVWLLGGRVAAQASDDQVLLDLSRQLLETQILEQDPSLLLSITDDTYVVIAPGGVIESREQAIQGLRAFETVDSISITNERVVRQGATAIVLDRLEIHGVIQGPMGQLGPTGMMTVYGGGDGAARGRRLGDGHSFIGTSWKRISAGDGESVKDSATVGHDV